MSLTTFLEIKDVRAKFSQEFPKPKFNLKKQILVPPITKHYSLVGTAFDYLMRFYLKCMNPKAITGEWVAELAVEKMRLLELSFSLDSRESEIKIDSNLLRKVDQIIPQAKIVYSNYLKSGEMNDEVIKSTILLAQLDTYFRAGVIDENLGMIDEGDIVDLKNLISNVNPDIFKAKKLCILNPTFGQASTLVGGADADFLIDNMLIDIKTTKKLELDRDYFNQVIGYYVLFRIGGIDDAPFDAKIETLGIYYSRYGELYAIPLKAVTNETKLPSFIEWFKKRAAEQAAL